MAEEAHPRKRRSTRTALLISLAGAVVLAAMMYFGYDRFLAWTSKELPFLPEDRRAVLTTDDLLTVYPGLMPAASAERCWKTRYVDHTWDLSYEYDHPDSQRWLYLYSSFGYFGGEADARTQFALLLLDDCDSLLSGDWGEGWTLEREDAGYRFGQQSRHWTIRCEGDLVGHQLILRQGRRIFFLLLYGDHHLDEGELKGLVLPVLERLTRFVPVARKG